VLLNERLCFCEPLRLESIVRGQFYDRLDSKLGLALGVLDMHVRLPHAKRSKTETLDAEDRRTH
jgi:hypothetical protein